MAIAADDARRVMDLFRSKCLMAARQCAVSGRGKSWCNYPTVGPSLQAYHIVPQQHYHVYPNPDGLGNRDNDDDDVLYSSARLKGAWKRTWSAENGILLLSHLHELFDARLFSIHPDTLRVRAFVPFDVLLDYHGRIAQVSADVDRAALRHHYDMCCIENMAAKEPILEAPPIRSGGASPFAARADAPSLGSARPHDVPRHPREPRDSQQATGDPSKRSRPEQDDVGYLDSGSTEIPSSIDDLSSDPWPHVSSKRQRLCCDEGGWDDKAMYTDEFLTSENCVEFPAGVNWGLKRALLVRRD